MNKKNALEEEIDELEEEIDELRDKLHRINTWCKAYPLGVFPEPNMVSAEAVLQNAGLSLGAISASNMRYVLKGIKEIIGED